MTAAEADIYRRCTGRTSPPTVPCREVWTIAGRRAGKSRISAFVTVFIAACRTYKLAPGERGIVPVISPSRAQSRVIFDYALAMLKGLDTLARLIERETSDSVDLANNRARVTSPTGFEPVFWP